MESIKLWGSIISNPFNGYSKMNESTKILFPLLLIIILTAGSIALFIPVMSSDEYSSALAKVQMLKLQEKGMSDSISQEELESQLSSPVTRKITIISAFAGGIVTYIIILLLSSFLLWLLTITIKDRKSYKLIFKILIYAAIVSTGESVLKSVIVISGDWERILRQVNSLNDFTLALQAPVSLAVLFDPDKIGKIPHFLIDTITDIFNWIYYIFIFAGLRSALKLERKKALGITLIFAAVFILAGIILTFLF